MAIPFETTAAAHDSAPIPAAVRLESVEKHYGDVVAVAGVDLEVRDGEFFSMLGPSGSGKTTTLRMIAGFEAPTSGTVYLDGKDVTTQAPFARNVNTVFQDYALFPHLDVLGNVEYGLAVKKENVDFVRFLNAMLEQMRSNGDWQRAFADSGLQAVLRTKSQPSADFSRV